MHYEQFKNMLLETNTPFREYEWKNQRVIVLDPKLDKSETKKVVGRGDTSFIFGLDDGKFCAVIT